MTDFVDDRAPLIQPFQRGSSLRTTFRCNWSTTDLSLQNPHNGLNNKPPVPPRLSEHSHRRPTLRRIQSVTEKETYTVHRNRVAAKPVHSIGGGDERHAIPVHRSYLSTHIISTAKDVASLHQRDAQSHAYTSGEGSLPRNGSYFASMPGTRETPPASPDIQTSSIWRLSSPYLSRRAAKQAEERTSKGKEMSTDSKSLVKENSFINKFRKSGRSQTPPISPPSQPFPVTYKKDVLTNQHSPSTFKRYGSVPMKKSEFSHKLSDVVTRSSSFRISRLERHQCSPPILQLPNLSSAHIQYKTEKYGITPDDLHRLRANMSPLHQRKDFPRIHSNLQHTAPHEKRDPRRFSYLRQPMPPYLGSDAEPQTQRHAPTYSGDLTSAATTIASCSPPTSHRLPGALDMYNRSPPQGLRNRSYSDTISGICSDDSGGGLRHRTHDGSLYLNRISSDSGYISPSNVNAPHRSNSIISDDEGDITIWYGSHRNLKEEKSLAAKSPTDHFSYLMEKENEYMKCLCSLLRDYQDMKTIKTPLLIRQHFDRIFKQVEEIYTFQLEFQDELRETHGRPEQVARAFTNEQFQCYGRYMVMTPAVLRDLDQFASHFKENFPHLKVNILKPSLRINFYAMILESIKKEALVEAKGELQEAINYLNQVKRKANTEMTLNTVIHSPVDLRLGGGDTLHMGELYYTGGGTLQKKKYQVILFENLLVITSIKAPFFKYKTHYRVEQLESVVASGENELFLNVLSEGQTQLVTLKFRIKTQKIRDEWISELQKITSRNTNLTQGRGSVNLLQIPRQQFRTLPLDLSRVFPLLKDTVTDDMAGEERTQSPYAYSLPDMITYEELYLKKLSSLLNPETQRPPEALSDLLEKLHRLHSKQFLPILHRSKKVGEFLDYLVENLDELSIYIDYLVTRSQLTVKLDQDPQAGPYICPVQHVYGIYFGLMKELCNFEKCKKHAQRVIRRLQEDIRIAQLRVLKEAIVHGRVDFQRSGSLLLSSQLEVKTRKKEIRAGEYIVLLFENVIILTRPKQPCYEYVMDIWLDQVNLGPPASSDCTFKVEVRQGGRKEPITYEMCASTVEVKQEWHKCLQQQMLVQVEKIRERVTSTSEAPGSAGR